MVLQTHYDPSIVVIGSHIGDKLTGLSNSDQLYGNGGDDTLIGAGGNDTLLGGEDNDLLQGGSGDDRLDGGEGNDVLQGGDGNDVLQGGDGSDDLHGGSGVDLLNGGRGDDILRQGSNADMDTFVFNQGDGTDTILEAGFNTMIAFGPGIQASDIVPVNFAPTMAFAYASVNGAIDRLVLADHAWQADFVDVRFADQTVRPLSDFIRHAPKVGIGMFDFAVQEGDSIALTIPDDAFVDVDAGDILRYELRTEQGGALPAWLSFDADARVMLLSPGYRDAGDLRLILTATDSSGQSASTGFTLQVGDLPLAPVVGTPMADQTVEEQRPFSLVLPSDMFVDEDDDGAGVMTVGALPAWLGFDALSRTLSGTPATPGAGPLAIDVTWTDSAGASASTSFNLNVAAAGSIALRGTAQADILHGKSNDDHLAGLGGNDQLYGHLGNDVLDGGAGRDTLAGGAGNDSYFVDAQDVVTEEADAGLDQISSAAGLTLPAHVEILSLTGSAAVNGRGNALDNLLKGNVGANQLNGQDGVDLLQGGAGNDTLTDTAGHANLLDGGAGADRLSGGDGNELFFGGKGADNIATGAGADLIVFNRGNGMDTVGFSLGTDNIVSLGGGIAYADLALRKSGADLILSAGAGDQITFKSWYAGPDHASVAVLQMVTAASADYLPGASSPIHDNKVETFDFMALIARFDQNRGALGSTWRFGASLEQFSNGGSDTAAIGGDLAYQYALNGNLATVGAAVAIAIVGSSGFGSLMQEFLPGASLNDGSPLLS
ncbi:putative Ig domain-containing protein [Massilia rubra]|nr:putative Ig domain-containing protein [Massilia rubra]